MSSCSGQDSQCPGEALHVGTSQWEHVVSLNWPVTQLCQAALCCLCRSLAARALLSCGRHFSLCTGKHPGSRRGPWQTVPSRGRCLEQEGVSLGQASVVVCVTQTGSSSLFHSAPVQTQPNSFLQECWGSPAPVIGQNLHARHASRNVLGSRSKWAQLKASQ